MFKKFVSVVLCVSMLLVLASGCSKKTTDPADNSGKTNNENYVVTYPIKTDKPVTLKYWIPLPAIVTNFIKNFGENEIFIQAAKDTGINVEFIHPAGGQEKEQFNLMIASGELPDIITGNPFAPMTYYNGGPSAGVDDGVFLDLTSYLPKYAPDFYKQIMSDESLYRDSTDDKGRIASFFTIKDSWPPFNRLQVRKDVLAEAGMEMPVVLDDYEKLFKKMLDLGITPYSPPSDGYEIKVMGMYDVVNNFYKKDNKVLFGQIQPEFKKYLELMNKWYAAGYISKDFMSNKVEDVRKLFDTKKVGMYGDAVDLVFSRMDAGKYDFIPLPYMRLTKDQPLHTEQVGITKYAGFDTVISKNSKNIETAIQWMNYFYTKQGSMLVNYGIEGSSYTMVDGKPKFTDKVLNNPTVPRGPAQNLFKVHAMPKLSDPDVLCNPNVVYNQKALDYRLMWSDDKKIDSSYILPPFKLNADENTERAQIMANVNSYVNEMVLKFITGAEPLSNFDKYVSTVKSMNIDKAIKLTQDAYNRYLSKTLPK